MNGPNGRQATAWLSWLALRQAFLNDPTGIIYIYIFILHILIYIFLFNFNIYTYLIHK
jgi:hypothetical protein